MPEGPEVEIVRKGLEKLLNQEVIGIIFSSHKKYSRQGKNTFSKLLKTRINSIERKGKWLIFSFSNGIKVINHLGMSGKWLIFENENLTIEEDFCFELDFKNIAPEQKKELFSKFLALSGEGLIKERKIKHGNYSRPKKGQKFIESQKKFTPQERIIEELIFDKHIKLIIFFKKHIAVFSDPRIFGQFTIVVDEYTKQQLEKIESLGPDILDDPFDTERLIRNLKKHPRLMIGVALLRTDIVLGIGNIYRAEALFRAKISPFKRIDQLNKNELRLLGEKIHEVGLESLKYGGSSIQTYVNTEGETGGMQERFLVYGREGEPCVICGDKIKKTRLDGRSIYWCDNCQK